MNLARSPFQRRPRFFPRRNFRPPAIFPDGRCLFGLICRSSPETQSLRAPAIIVPPKRIHNVTGAQVYLSCEVKAVPTPIITWKKVTESPKGVRLLEELPGDRVNMAVQVRGGPSKHESTGWVLINPLTKDDEGVYQCHATNMMGEAKAEGTIKVLHQNKNKKDHFPASEDMK